MRKPRILIVDDEPLIRSSLTGVLQDEGYDTLSADTGEACCTELARATFDVVLLDVWLPGMDGMETLSRIQEIPFAARPAVVIISGHGNIEAAVRATKLGAFDFLEKPLTIQKVSVTIKNALQQRKLELELERFKETDHAHPRDYRRQRSGARTAPATFPDGGHQRPRVDLWRERDGKGVGGARDP